MAVYFNHEEQTFAFSKGSIIRIGDFRQDPLSMGRSGKPVYRSHRWEPAAHSHRGDRAIAQARERTIGSRAMRALCTGVERKARAGWHPGSTNRAAQGSG